MEIKVDGLEETFALLKDAPRNLVARGFRRGLQAAGNVIGAELAKRTPQREGKLIRSIKTDITLDSQFRGGEVDINFGAQGYKAAWVEYGHRMVGHKPGKKLLGEVAPHPFMRPAANAAGGAAVDAFEAELEQTIREEYGNG